MIHFSMRHAGSSLLLLASLLCAAGCGESAPRMDVRVEVRCTQQSLPATGPLELTYFWQLAADAEAPGFDCLVYAHFRNADGDILWQDDHQPPVPTSRWRPGQTVEYRRIHFIPDTAPAEEVTLTVGLYDQQGTEGKVILAGRHGRAPGYDAARLDVLPAGRLPIVIYDQGWYNQESKPGQLEGPTWRWCRREAVCWAELPGRPCSLFLEVQAPLQTLDPAQPVTLELEGVVLAFFEIDGPGPVVHKFRLPEQLTAGKECVRLVVRTDRAAQPQPNGDAGEKRELGLRFFHLAVY
jgi:hypothetical protein